jgi:hypothetical protein
MEAVLEQLGAYRGWNGRVNPASYGLMKAKLEKCLGCFLDREAQNGRNRSKLGRSRTSQRSPGCAATHHQRPDPHQQVQFGEGTKNSGELEIENQYRQ